MLSSRLLNHLALSFVAAAGLAVVPPDESRPLHQVAFRHPDLWWESVYRPVAELPVEAARSLGRELDRLGVDPGNAYFDARTGRWGTLILTRPMIPGSGVGNTLSWSDFSGGAPETQGEREQAAWEAFRRFLVDNVARLRIDPAELGTPRVTALGERLIHIHVGRRIDGIPARDTFVKATLNGGNLVLLGERNWVDAALDIRPRISPEEAQAALGEHLGAIAVSGFHKAAKLELVPVSSQREAAGVELGAGLRYRLVWVLRPTFDGDRGRWEALIDAHDGEVLSFQDTNHYASRRVTGSVFPVSNDGQGEDGTLQPGFPMPFADIALDGEPLGFTSTGGNVPPGADTGTISTTLFGGRYVRMNDFCGAVDESAESGDLDLEGVDGTDCAVPPGHSAGDTNASRSGFYELNRLTEQARGYLPGNAWLDQQLTANMNINNNCNAFWNGATVNFYTSGGGCANTGEIAAIFDHEWGHGMDNNDAAPSISLPGEGIADIYAINRLNDSCVGRGFRIGQNCTGNGDPCLDCTGVRETDWMKHQSMQPHGVSWILSNCGFPPGGVGPCGRGTHCEGHVVSESAWDLVHRDLMGFEGSSFDLDLNTALELGTRLAYDGSSGVFNWYQCVADGTGGCNPDSGYLGYLAADDDNGDLTDGTPHMSAIFAAFDRHQIACPTPTVQDAGCAGAPSTAPTNVTVTSLNEAAHLSWDPVAGASEYRIFRTEGVNGCDFGKTLVATTADTQFVESGLGNDFEVLYSVAAVGENDACASPMSACEAVIPTPGPGLGFTSSSPVWAAQTGDGDEFFDNCETWTLTFEVANTGVGALTDVRIVDASIVSHPGAFVATPLPATLAGSLAEGATADGVLEARGVGFEFNDTLELEVEVTADELSPLTLTHTYTLTSLESDLEAQPSVTFSFEEGDDTWQLVSGTFDRTDAGGGADGTSFYRASSVGLNQQCDRIRSPLVRLTETSTLELYNQFDIEGFNQFWWDRANVGVFDPVTGERTVVEPDGGRLYNADGTNPAPAPCASADLPGWASQGPEWMPSSWSASALGAPDLAGRLVQLDVAYGTDPDVTGDFGFWFDEVTLTDVALQVPDGQPNVCSGFPHLSFDPASLDLGDTLVGTTVGPLTATLHNTGDTDATGLDFGTPGNGFEANADACGETLAAGASCDIDVTFTPTTPGPAVATLNVDSGEGPDATLFLTGNGDPGAALFEPIGLRADPTPTVLSNGNGVFEPAELVIVAPEWRNDGSAAGTLSSSASDFTGPPGATYTLAEDSADYGEVAIGETRSCLAGGSCFEMGLSEPAVRPATRWDATFEESLPGGGTKTWTLHIGESFADVPATNPFYSSIETLLHGGVTGGCADDVYCPGGVVSRSQLPVFVLRALEGSGYVPPACVEDAETFSDVPASSPFCGWIEELHHRNVVSGCGDGAYCPNDSVTRAQMAIFLLKTLEGDGYTPTECTARFDDVPCSSLFADWIEDLAVREITGGCSATAYCPAEPVSRAQMAVFVTRTFGLTLYGP